MAQGLQISCDFCKKPVNVPGGLLFTTIKSTPDIMKKEHICASCVEKVETILAMFRARETDWGVYYWPPLDDESHVLVKPLGKWEVDKLRKSLGI